MREQISQAIEDRVRKYLELIAWLAKRLRREGLRQREG